LLDADPQDTKQHVCSEGPRSRWAIEQGQIWGTLPGGGFVDWWVSHVSGVFSFQEEKRTKPAVYATKQGGQDQELPGLDDA
jgi:hypothetical protein